MQILIYSLYSNHKRVQTDQTCVHTRVMTDSQFGFLPIRNGEIKREPDQQQLP